MKLQFLGYGSNSFSSLKTVSFLLKEKEEILLVDCGPAITYNLHAVVPNFTEVTNVFISHSHFDHFLGLPYFIIGRHLDVITAKKKNSTFIPSKLNVYLPKDLIEIVKNLINVCHKDIKSLSYDIEYFAINETEKIQFLGYHLIPFKVDHTVETYGFSLFNGDTKLLSYTSDTLYNENVIEQIKESKYLILEGMVPETETKFSENSKHATFTQMKNVVANILPKMAFVIHLQPRYIKDQDSIIQSLNNIDNTEILFPNEDVEYVLCL